MVFTDGEAVSSSLREEVEAQKNSSISYEKHRREKKLG